ncbi:MAG: hypothetical protein P8K09_06590 [Hyphomicrobiales bacterium]|nr:hypothetical protein [Hyphomicrobiales bacterium]|tara:strand:+ start:1797 stop:2861 length:1065 start_codon:yes stop_codon:yes gene_type:complete
MGKQYSIIILGASYGSLLGIKLAMAGHKVDLVCLPDEVKTINENGAIVRLPIREKDTVIELNSKNCSGVLAAIGTDNIKLDQYDLVALAMQEPQYGADVISQLLKEIGEKKLPCMSIMNMPPLAYIARIEGLDTSMLTDAYTKADVWQYFDPANITLCSPDPQAFRPPDEPINVLQVGLPTNFKVARFESEEHTKILRDLQRDIEEVTYDYNGESIGLPVKLKVHDSIFVPLAKWSMLLAGNYRCVQEEQAVAIREAVHTDLEKSKEIYNWVSEIAIELGAISSDQVPFEKYALAAQSLIRPSSAARALFAGAKNIERVDKLIKLIAHQIGKDSSIVDEIIDQVDRRVSINRSV